MKLGMIIVLLLMGEACLLGDDLSAIIQDISAMEDGSIKQARTIAQIQAAGDLPRYRSTTPNETRTFSGKYTPPQLPEDKKNRFVYGLVLFSDDGCNVTFNGVRVHSNLRRNQHLPSLDGGIGSGPSFNQLPVVLAPGQEVSITVEYSNTIYVSRPDFPDIDGCSLFVVLLSVELATDVNRDGAIRFAGNYNDPATNGKPMDITTESKPYRFWCNDDYDSSESEDDLVRTGIKDYTDKLILSTRDLEDFSRLWIYLGGVQELLARRELFVGLKWKHVSNSPSINLYEHVELGGGVNYLTVDVIARSQARPGVRTATFPNRNAEHKSIAAGEPFVFNHALANGLPSPTAKKHFLFEGSGEGKGQLIITFHTPDGKEICEGPGLWLDLTNIKTMYQRAKATPDTAESIEMPYEYTGPHRNPPEPMMGWETVTDYAFKPASDEDLENKNYVIFVHGWRLSYEMFESFSETMFKRLWWRGFKGRFAAFRWSTYWFEATGTRYDGALASFNESEFIAWKSGKILKLFVESLPSGYTRNLVAHSMGNIVAGSAIIQGLTVKNYALLNAAVPAICYDENPALRQEARWVAANVGPYDSTPLPLFPRELWDTPTPDSDPDPWTRGLSYGGRFRDIRGNLMNFYLPDDVALSDGSWEINNDFQKPYDPWGSGQYLYEPDQPPMRKLSLSFVLSVGRYLRSFHEAMAFASQSPTRAAGAEARTEGSIDGRINMNEEYGFGSVHSAQWVRRIQLVQPFYYDLLKYFDISQSYLSAERP